MSAPFIFAIDGPGGAGKSTVARRVAAELGLTLVDTGAFYRAAALLAERRGIADEDELSSALEAVEIRFREHHVLLDGEDVSEAIRRPEISVRSSQVSAMPGVRAALLQLQRDAALAEPQGAVLEGRDIGTVVFPDAHLKVFLTASLEERARRRTDELAARGRPQPREEVLAELSERDARDRGRPIAPLVAADDAIIVDTTGRPLEAVVHELVALATGRM